MHDAPRRKPLAKPAFLFAAMLLCLALMGIEMAARAQAKGKVLSEYQVQAAYILNFIRFTTWPSSAFADPQQDIVLGIYGEDNFGTILDDLDGTFINQRRLQIVRLGTGGDLHGCHLLYISGSEHRRLQQILRGIKKEPTLTISDMDNFAAEGGMIQLKRVDDKYKLILNTNSTKSAGLQLRANLLKIATLVGQAAPESPR
ncbi:MAG: YfiR family protein [Desulfobulbaceae bacterium]|nr:YfiR family protein [Desulfobulbaceae bacterium]